MRHLPPAAALALLALLALRARADEPRFWARAGAPHGPARRAAVQGDVPASRDGAAAGRAALCARAGVPDGASRLQGKAGVGEGSGRLRRGERGVARAAACSGVGAGAGARVGGGREGGACGGEDDGVEAAVESAGVLEGGASCGASGGFFAVEVGDARVSGTGTGAGVRCEARRDAEPGVAGVVDESVSLETAVEVEGVLGRGSSLARVTSCGVRSGGLLGVDSGEVALVAAPVSGTADPAPEATLIAGPDQTGSVEESVSLEKGSSEELLGSGTSGKVLSVDSSKVDSSLEGGLEPDAAGEANLIDGPSEPSDLLTRGIVGDLSDGGSDGAADVDLEPSLDDEVSPPEEDAPSGDLAPVSVHTAPESDVPVHTAGEPVVRSRWWAAPSRELLASAASTLPTASIPVRASAFRESAMDWLGERASAGSPQDLLKAAAAAVPAPDEVGGSVRRALARGRAAMGSPRELLETAAASVPLSDKVRSGARQALAQSRGSSGSPRELLKAAAAGVHMPSKAGMLKVLAQARATAGSRRDLLSAAAAAVSRSEQLGRSVRETLEQQHVPIGSLRRRLENAAASVRRTSGLGGSTPQVEAKNDGLSESLGGMFKGVVAGIPARTRVSEGMRTSWQQLTQSSTSSPRYMSRSKAHGIFQKVVWRVRGARAPGFARHMFGKALWTWNGAAQRVRLSRRGRWALGRLNGATRKIRGAGANVYHRISAISARHAIGQVPRLWDRRLASIWLKMDGMWGRLPKVPHLSESTESTHRYARLRKLFWTRNISPRRAQLRHLGHATVLAFEKLRRRGLGAATDWGNYLSYHQKVVWKDLRRRRHRAWLWGRHVHVYVQSTRAKVAVAADAFTIVMSDTVVGYLAGGKQSVAGLYSSAVRLVLSGGHVRDMVFSGALSSVGMVLYYLKAVAAFAFLICLLVVWRELRDIFNATCFVLRAVTRIVTGVLAISGSQISKIAVFIESRRRSDGPSGGEDIRKETSGPVAHVLENSDAGTTS